MITKIFGTIDAITESSIILENNGIYYDVNMPPVQIAHIRKTHKTGDSILLFTKYYVEGGVGVGNLFPRLIGFAGENDRKFFEIFTTVKGLGERKALQAITIPVAELGRAIESGDVFTLKKLPGIGGRMADKIVAELRGKVTRFAGEEDREPPAGEQRLAPGMEEEVMNILIAQLGYRRIEAENLVRKASAGDRSFESVEDLLQSIFTHIPGAESR